MRGNVLPLGYPINEVFPTIQGEGRWTGTPSLFIRFQGCPVGCPWCDTKHTWAVEDQHRVAIGDLLLKDKAAPTWASLTMRDLQTLMGSAEPVKHAVITGGEPCLHDLDQLTTAIVQAGWTPQVETSGTQPIRVHRSTWVTVSPKIGMPGGLEVREASIARANEIKFPVGRIEDIIRLQERVLPHATTDLVWLQPISMSEKATKLCIDQALCHGYNVSIQTHRYAGVR